jgi:GWxTD domain-containing protein
VIVPFWLLEMLRVCAIIRIDEGGISLCRGAVLTCARRFRDLLAFSLLLSFVSLSFASSYAQEQSTTRYNPYKRWLDEGVRWIITDQERADFAKLSADRQRDEFVIAFWERRNPPGATENTFKQEHYRRLAYANENFAAGVPGWQTDRGRFYIMYGPPDKVERHTCSKHEKENIAHDCFASEEWHWRYIEGLGCDFVLKFVDSCGCGDFHVAESGEIRSRRMLSPNCLVDRIRFP